MLIDRQNGNTIHKSSSSNFDLLKKDLTPSYLCINLFAYLYFCAFVYALVFQNEQEFTFPYLCSHVFLCYFSFTYSFVYIFPLVSVGFYLCLSNLICFLCEVLCIQIYLQSSFDGLMYIFVCASAFYMWICLFVRRLWSFYGLSEYVCIYAYSFLWFWLTEAINSILGHWLMNLARYKV